MKFQPFPLACRCIFDLFFPHSDLDRMSWGSCLVSFPVLLLFDVCCLPSDHRLADRGTNAYSQFFWFQLPLFWACSAWISMLDDVSEPKALIWVTWLVFSVRYILGFLRRHCVWFRSCGLLLGIERFWCGFYTNFVLIICVSALYVLIWV